MKRIKIYITREEYQTLLSCSPDKRIIQVGNDWYQVTELTPKILKAVPYLPINIIGKFREERDQQYRDTQELTPYE